MKDTEIVLRIPIPTEGITVIRERAWLVTERNCEAEHNITSRFLRKAAKNGLPHMITPDGVASLLSDFESWVKNNSIVVEKPALEPANDSDLDEADILLMAAGARKGR